MAKSTLAAAAVVREDFDRIAVLAPPGDVDRLTQYAARRGARARRLVDVGSGTGCVVRYAAARAREVICRRGWWRARGRRAGRRTCASRWPT
jgi:hypothetical protein